jgi:hypothetical protein
LSEHEVLSAREAVLGRPAAERALRLLHAAEEPDAARLPIGARDTLLVDLRERLFGSTLTASVNCPECGQEQEFDVPASALRAGASPLPAALSTTCDGVEIRFRLPDSTDLLAISGEPTVDSAKRVLLERCVIEPGPLELPDAAIDAVSSAMAEADPAADSAIALECAACKHPWSEMFDIASFLLSEINAWASHTVREVHQLAAAYGWSESECLSVSPWRRSRYLELIAE